LDRAVFYLKEAYSQASAQRGDELRGPVAQFKL
jgi:hypothetical protein